MSKLLCDYEVVDSKIGIEIPWLEYIQSQGYEIEAINNLNVVESGSRDASHLVAQIETYKYPRGAAILDVADPDHQVETWVCSCEDFRYNKSVDVSESDLSPDMADVCKHIKQVSKVERARKDENQNTLV